MTGRQRHDEELFGIVERWIAAEVRIGGSTGRRLALDAILVFARVRLIRARRAVGCSGPYDSCSVLVAIGRVGVGLQWSCARRNAGRHGSPVATRSYLTISSSTRVPERFRRADL